VWFDGVRSGDFDVALEANCQKVVNPFADVGRWLPQEVYRESVHYLFLFLFALVLSSAAVCVHLCLSSICRRPAARPSRRARVPELAVQCRLPAMFTVRDFWGWPNELWTKHLEPLFANGSAGGQDLKGSKPANLPVEQPTKFEQASISRQPRHLG
jgi:hypothetical protein